MANQQRTAPTRTAHAPCMHRRTAHRANAHPDQRTAHRARTARTDTPRSPLPETKRARAHAPITAQTSLMGRVTIRHNPPIQRYWHMGNNDIVILNMPQVWYGQQRYRHTADSASDLCARRHTALLVYAAAGILRQRDSTLCAYAPTSLLQTILNSNNNENHSYCKRFSIAITARTILIENENQ
jgi:hypothetical protein